MVVRVGLAGSRGYGRVHLDQLAPRVAAGRVRLVGVADPAGRSEFVPDEVVWYPSLGDLLAAETCDVVIVATPIHTHAALATEAMRAGAHVYLEKPPVASLASFGELLGVADRTGRAVQVGFQSLGSAASARIGELVASGALGTVRVVAATGLWLRTASYFARSDWAGRRRLGERVVADGVATNALAHAVAHALTLADITRLEQVRTVTTELYKAHTDNESDDTSWVRVDADGRTPVSAALTLCAPRQLTPRIDVIGDRGRVSFRYTEDVLEITTPDEPVRTETFDRIDLVDDLVDHVRDPTAPLRSPLIAHGAYTAVLQAIQDAPPTDVVDHLRWLGSDGDRHAVLDDAERLLVAAAESGAGFAAAGAPWADPATVHTWTPPTTSP